MKIIDSRTGNLQAIPFALGETGRGRHFEVVQVSNRPGQVPSGPDDVSYFQHGVGDRQHVILTSADGRRGILLRINTVGTYTQGSCGSIDLLAGQAKLVAAGQWAEGGAGRSANGPDQLWHVEGPSLWDVVLQGGAHKGYGHRYLIVTRSLRVTMVTADALAQTIATDSDPEVTEVVREHRGVLGLKVQEAASPFATTARADRCASILAAIDLADRLEEAVPATSGAVTHFASRPVVAAVQSYGIAIPVVMDVVLGGVSGVEAGTLVPGACALVDLRIGPGGGKRYSYETVAERGLTMLAQRRERPYTSESRLCRVDDPAWMIAWTSSRDGVVTMHVIADAGGCHTVWADGDRHTDPWDGCAAGPMPDFTAVFGLGGRSAASAPVSRGTDSGSDPEAAKATLVDLQAKFGRR